MKLIITPIRNFEVSAEVFWKPPAELSDGGIQVICQAVPMNASEMESGIAPARR